MQAIIGFICYVTVYDDDAIFEYCDNINKVGFDNLYEYLFVNHMHYLDSNICM